MLCENDCVGGRPNRKGKIVVRFGRKRLELAEGNEGVSGRLTDSSGHSGERHDGLHSTVRVAGEYLSTMGIIHCLNRAKHPLPECPRDQRVCGGTVESFLVAVLMHRVSVKSFQIG